MASLGEPLPDVVLSQEMEVDETLKRPRVEDAGAMEGEDAAPLDEDPSPSPPTGSDEASPLQDVAEIDKEVSAPKLKKRKLGRLKKMGSEESDASDSDDYEEAADEEPAAAAAVEDAPEMAAEQLDPPEFEGQEPESEDEEMAAMKNNGDDSGSDYEDEEEAYMTQLKNSKLDNEVDDDDYVPPEDHQEGGVVSEPGVKRMTKKEMAQMVSENQRLIRETKTRFPQAELKRKEMSSLLDKLSNRSAKLGGKADANLNEMQIDLADDSEEEEEAAAAAAAASGSALPEVVFVKYLKNGEDVEVVATHFDDGAANPYYTIKLADGTEKQTIARHLDGLPDHMKPPPKQEEEDDDLEEAEEEEGTATEAAGAEVAALEGVDDHELQVEDMSDEEEQETEVPEEGATQPVADEEPATQLASMEQEDEEALVEGAATVAEEKPAEEEPATQPASEEEAEPTTQEAEYDHDSGDAATEEADTDEEADMEPEMQAAPAADADAKIPLEEGAAAPRVSEVAQVDPAKAADPLSFLMAVQEVEEAAKPKLSEDEVLNQQAKNFVDAEASEEEDIYDYGSDENEDNLDGEVEDLVDKEPVEITDEQAAEGVAFDVQRAELDDDKRLKQVQDVIEGKHRHGRRGQYRRSGMREGLLDEEEDDSDSDSGDDDEMSDATESESDGEAILGKQADDEEAGSDADDWDEEKQRRLRLRRERLRRQELQEQGGPSPTMMKPGALLLQENSMMAGGGNSLLNTDDVSKDVLARLNKTNVSRTVSLLANSNSLGAGGLSRTVSAGANPLQRTQSAGNLGRSGSTATFGGDSNDASKAAQGLATKLRRHGSFLGLSANKREKAAAFGGGSLLAGRSSFIFAADDSCSQFGEDTPSSTGGEKLGRSSSRASKLSSKAAKRGTGNKRDKIASAGQALFRTLSC